MGTRLQLAILLLLAASWCASAFAELQNTINLTAPKLFNGYDGSFVVSQTSGAPSVASGTISKTYSGISKFTIDTASGRYASLPTNIFYGMEIGPLYLFRSFLSNRFLTVVNSAKQCPSAGTYNWIMLRGRSPTTPTQPMNATSTSFIGGGSLAYDPAGAHLFTGSSSFDLAGPTNNASPSYNLDGFSGATCSNATMKYQTAGTQTPFQSFGYLFFTDRSFITLATGGDPNVAFGTVQENLSAPTLAGLSGSVFSGLYTSYDTATSQTQQNIYFYPDSNGTTYTLYTVTNPADPDQKTAFGTLACTNLNSPSTGFCRGTLTLSGVAGTGKAVCLIAAQTPEKIIACSAQRPDSNSVPVSMIGVIPSKSVLALSKAAASVSANSGSSTTFSVTLKNLSGRAIPTIGNPASAPLQLAAPFSNAGAWAGTSGTCSNNLAAFSSCNVTLTFAPSSRQSYLQTFRVAYSDGYFGTVNATIPVMGTANLVSIAITPATSSFPAGTAIQYTATATYSDNSTQDVTSIVTWSSSNSSVASVLAKGSTTFLSTGSANIQATLAGISATKATTVSGGSVIQVLGQSSATAFAGAVTGLNGPRGMIYAGSRLFVADTFNNRVLIWDSLPSSNQVPPDRVVGQADFNGQTENYGGVTSSSLYQPLSITSDGTRLVVADSYNHRVLIWNSIPTTNFQAADIVLGQPDMVSNTANNGGISASRLNYPVGVSISGGKLFVVDFGNNRVLIWNTFPTSSGQAANLVLGQPNMTSSTANNGGVTAQSFNQPYGCYADGTRFFVGDAANNRVLMWTSIPTSNRQAANIVLGQPNMTSSTLNNGGLDASAMNSPREIYSTGTKLMVSDRSNNRVMIWNTMPAANNANANFVLGQPNLTTGTANTGGTSAGTLFEPYGVYMDSSRAMVADISNNRILIWSSAPSANGQSANFLLGQPDFAASGINGTGYAYSDSLASPNQITSNGTVYVVADTVNNRVLLWNTVPIQDGEPADVVVGQPDFTTNSPGLTAAKMNTPRSAIISGTKLIVADSGNNRVLIWNTIPTSNNASANVVVGQANMTTGTSACTQGGLNNPYNVATDGTALFVADYGNNRILKWNAIPTSSNTNSDLRLGQANFTTCTANTGGVSATSLSSPASLAIAGTNLIAGDYLNSRVLIWTTIPTNQRQAANLVLGQPNMTTNTYNNGGPSTQSISYATGLYSNGTALYVADQANNRVLGWSTFPASNRAAADRVIGQPNFTTATVNNGGLSATSLSAPSGVYVNSTNAWIADTSNHRILVTPITANLTISDGPIYDYLDVVLNSSSDRTFTVTNIGSGSATSVGAGTPALAAPFAYVGGTYPGTGGTCGTTIAAQSSCTIVVRFNPTSDAADFSDVVRLTYNDGSATRVAMVGVMGTAILQAALTFQNGATYAFGTKTVNSNTDATLTLSNASGVTATGVQPNTALTSPFTYKGGNYPGTGGTCGSVLATGSTCTVLVRFTPPAKSAYNQSLIMQYYNGKGTSTLSTSLTGTGN